MLELGDYIYTTDTIPVQTEEGSIKKVENLLFQVIKGGEPTKFQLFSPSRFETFGNFETIEELEEKLCYTFQNFHKCNDRVQVTIADGIISSI